MKNVLEFLSLLRVNNNKPWFDAHKEMYRAASEEFNLFAEKLIGGIASFDPAVKGLTLKECTYRIYRDVRFSADKTPYKTHIGVYICPRGKKSGLAGYYFHVEPKGEGLLGGSLLSAGLYMPEPVVLKSLRDEIFADGAKLLSSAGKAQKQGFELDMSSQLKRTPKGYPSDSKYDAYLRLKDLHLVHYVADDFLYSPDLLATVLDKFRSTAGFVAILNRAALFAKEEM